jgi:hypothetical protein
MFLSGARPVTKTGVTTAMAMKVGAMKVGARVIRPTRMRRQAMGCLQAAQREMRMELFADLFLDLFVGGIADGISRGWTALKEML